MNILIIDDDTEDTEIFCHALKEVAPGINCLVVNNPKTGLTFLKNNTIAPQYIFLDANMFLIDGRECLIQLRKMPALASTRIIMYSGYLSEKQVAELKNLGADDYLHKPNTYEELRHVLSNLFASRTE